MNKVLKLENNLEHKKFYDLLDICFELSTHFSMTKHNFHIKDDSYINFCESLNPLFIRTIITHHWFSYYLLNENFLEVCLYHADKSAKSIIKSKFDNLFLLERSMDGSLLNPKNLPEDLCFFYQGKLLLGTVSHENICCVYPFSLNIYNRFIELGKWQETSSSTKEHITIEI